MKRQSRFPLLLLAAVVIALAYLGGTLAPPLHGADTSGTVAPAVTLQQWWVMKSAVDLLLSESDETPCYLPLVMR